MSINYNNIKELCTLHNITIAQLEKELNFGEGLISKWKVSSPSVNKILAIAKYFNVSTDYILGKSQVSQTVEVILSDDDIVMLLAAVNKMDEYDKDKMMKILKLVYESAFI